MSHQGLFITFEGIDGAGKTTQVKMLADKLREANGSDVFVTREPGEGVLGQELRRLILHPPQDVPIDDRAELLILLADRAQHVSTMILPHLAKGGTVICDRYADSSIAYQGYGRGIATSEVKRLNVFATAGLWPDITVLIDIDPEKSVERQIDRSRMTSESRAFYRCVRDAFLRMAMEQNDRFLIVDGSKSIAMVHEEIWELLRPRLRQRERWLSAA